MFTFFSHIDIDVAHPSLHYSRCHQDVIFQTKSMKVTLLSSSACILPVRHTSNIWARHSALLSHLLVITDSAQTSLLFNVEYDKKKQSKKTTQVPEPLYPKLSCLWTSCCHWEVSCWMASVHSYDMLWYNLAKNYHWESARTAFQLNKPCLKRN